MATDEERRLIAERLRMADERDAAGFDCLLAEAIRGYYFCKTTCESCHGRLLGELADLVEPSCDREALLTLAEELASVRRWSCYTDSDLLDIAERIREACGVVS